MKKKRDQTIREDGSPVQELPDRTYIRAFGISPSPIVISTAMEGRIIEVNRAFSRFTGYSRQELIGVRAVDLNLWSSNDARKRFWQMLVDRKSLKNVEMSLRVKGDRCREVLLSAELIRVEDRLCVLAVVSDITDLIRAERALQESEQRYHGLFDNSRDAIITTRPDGSFVNVNPSALNLFGYSRREMMRKNVTELYLDPADRRSFVETIEETGGVRDFEVRMRRKNGTVMDCLFTFSLRRGSGGLREYQGIVRDVTERRRMMEDLKDLSLRDELTGLNNRRGFFTMAEQQIRMVRRMKRNLYCVFIDLDYLKQINDRFGHKEGDRALVGTSKILKRSFREADILARMGGDEFAILIIDDFEMGEEVILNRLAENTADYNRTNRRGYEVSLSAGIALLHYDSTVSLQELLDLADTKMYENKRRKRAVRGEFR